MILFMLVGGSGFGMMGFFSMGYFRTVWLSMSVYVRDLRSTDGFNEGFRFWMFLVFFDFYYRLVCGLWVSRSLVGGRVS